MRHAQVFLSVIALAASCGMSMRFFGRQLPWMVAAYLAVQCLFALIAWWGIQVGSLESVSYMRFFGLFFAAALLLAVMFAVKMAMLHPQILGAWLLFGTLLQTSVVASIVYWELVKTYWTVPAQLQMSLLQGFVLSFCGIVTLVALATDLSPELRYAAMALGTFWTLLGVMAFAWTLGIGRNRSMWLHLNNFIPAFLAIVCFSWMAVKLNGLQTEGSRQEVPAAQHIVMEGN